MDSERARTLLAAEHAQLRAQVGSLASSDAADRIGADEPGDSGDRGQELTALGTDALVEDELARRLGAIERAVQRLDAGTYGVSVISGDPIPDERLEADPAAEMTVEEARELEAEQR